ncbi:MAG TPA: branched-chain amino acid ABC transporter substrate-binding protein [Gaiellaceae bacterium]|nr:branched-chain amino acid ABC transporter substrate-binding protein [Gaiellaceae bacterium]
MTKRLLGAFLVAVTGTLVLATVGSGGTSARQATPLPASSCSPIVYKGSGSPKYIVASDLPLQGSGRAQTIEMTKAIQFVLSGAGWKAGAYTLGYQSCDDSTAQAGKWDSAKCSANGNAYARDQDVIGVIGTFNSGCAEIIVPILNRAPGGPVGMVSPANTYTGLTVAGNGTAAGEPGKYYPTGKRNYVRVVAQDQYQGAADALLAQRLGAKNVYVLNDKEAYGLGVATNFRNSARKLGIKIAGFEAFDPKASSYAALASKIKDKGATGVFIGGLICENGGKLIKDLRSTLGAKVKLILPDGFTPISAVVEGAGKAAESAYVSVAGVPNSQLKGQGRAFLNAFRKQIHKDPDPYSSKAAQAAVVMLSAIAKSNGSRSSVASQLFKVNLKGSIQGDVRFDKNGDITGGPIAIYLIKGGKSTDYTVIRPPVALAKAS